MKAFRDYRSAQKKTLRALADDVRAGKVTDKTAFLRRLADGAQPFEVALDLVFEQNSDTAGKVTKPAALADLLMKASEVFP